VPELPTAWGESWLWLGGSLLLAILWANLARFFRRPRAGAIGELATRLAVWRVAPWLLQFLRLLYYVGAPFTALVWRRAINERYVGLRLGTETIGPATEKWADWVHNLGWAAALGIGAWVLLAIGWWAYRRALAIAGEKGVVAGTDVSGWVLLREAAYHEVHWAFYRNAPILTANAYWEKTAGEYWGVWAGLALVALEAVLNPAWRKGLADPQKAPAQLMRGALAVVSSVLFLKTENLWLALALHWGISWGLVMLVRVLPPLPARAPDQAYA
jgi:hypothetical protein